MQFLILNRVPLNINVLNMYESKDRKDTLRLENGVFLDQVKNLGHVFGLHFTEGVEHIREV